MSVTTVTSSTGNPSAVIAGEARQEPRIANTWLRRLRRKVRGWIGPAQPAADGWLAAGGPVMVIAPHPDDEVIGCGGTVIRHVRAGDQVSIIYLTRGERSRGFPWLSAAQKQARRMKEAICSCSILGVTDTLFLDGVDGNLSDP